MGLRIFSPLMPLIIGGSIDQGFVSPDCPLIPNPSPKGRREPDPVPLSLWAIHYTDLAVSLGGKRF
jgi:hypothetical protein